MDHREYRHSTLFRSSKYTYTIDLQYFTAKKYYLPVPICLGTWNPKTESLTRKVIVYEEDDSAEEEFNVDYDIVKMNSSKFSGNGKIGLGVGKFNIEVGGGAEDVSQNTTTIKKTVKVKRPQNSDYLGTADIYYYHPFTKNSFSSGFIIYDKMEDSFTSNHTKQDYLPLIREFLFFKKAQVFYLTIIFLPSIILMPFCGYSSF